MENATLIITILFFITINFMLTVIGKHWLKFVIGLLTFKEIKKVVRNKSKYKVQSIKQVTSSEIYKFNLNKTRIRDMIRHGFIRKSDYAGNGKFNFLFPKDLENYMLWKFPMKSDIQDINNRLQDLFSNRNTMRDCERWIYQEIVKGC